MTSEPPDWAEQVVRLLDDGFRVPGTRIRFGFDGLLGLLLPVFGDATSAVGSLSLFWLAIKRDVPRAVLLQMALNVALDVLVGAVPVVGDVFDFGWKANRRNLTLIRAATRAVPERRSKLADYFFIAGIALLVGCAFALPLLLAA
ncbi:MAG TPA: DUF4112 domain-containing protein, partial [Polyangiales bacterium]